MNNKLIFILAVLALFCIISIPNISAEDEEITSQIITISNINDTYQIKEKDTFLRQDNNMFFTFQFPDEAEDIKIYVDNNVINDPVINGMNYVVNITSFNINKSELTFELIYYLPLSINSFSKICSYNISETLVKFEGREIFSGRNFIKGSLIDIELFVPNQESLSIYILILIVLLIIIIIVTSWYAFFKKKNGKTRNRNFESSELLTTEKTLLLEVLKEIEKMYRNKKISDESYHKLKAHYKQQTVDIMSALEEAN